MPRDGFAPDGQHPARAWRDSRWGGSAFVEFDATFRANASATCDGTTCEFTCNAGFVDCDGDPANGCEVATSSDPAHCGACATSCGPAGSCVSGACRFPTSCSAIHAASPATPSGTYAIDPDGTGGAPPFDAYCDMVTSGGGWILCFSYDTSNYDAPNWPSTAGSLNKLLAQRWGTSDLFGNGTRQGNFCNVMSVVASTTMVRGEVVNVADSSVLTTGDYVVSHADFFTQVHAPHTLDCLVDTTGTRRLMYANYGAPVGGASDSPALAACSGAASIDEIRTMPGSVATFGVDGFLVNSSEASGNRVENELGLMINWYSDIPTNQLFVTSGSGATQLKFGFNATWLVNAFGRSGMTPGPTQCWGFCGFTNAANNTLKQRLWVR